MAGQRRAPAIVDGKGNPVFGSQRMREGETQEQQTSVNYWATPGKRSGYTSTLHAARDHAN
jgi:hypothetical protein